MKNSLPAKVSSLLWSIELYSVNKRNVSPNCSPQSEKRSLFPANCSLSTALLEYYVSVTPVFLRTEVTKTELNWIYLLDILFVCLRAPITCSYATDVDALSPYAAIPTNISMYVCFACICKRANVWSCQLAYAIYASIFLRTKKWLDTIYFDFDPLFTV